MNPRDTPEYMMRVFAMATKPPYLRKGFTPPSPNASDPTCRQEIEMARDYHMVGIRDHPKPPEATPLEETFPVPPEGLGDCHWRRLVAASQLD